MKNNRFRFTKRVLETLVSKHEKRPTDFYDDSNRGLMLRVSPKGLKTFYLLRKVSGKTERIHLGRFPETTIDQARKRSAKINMELDAGVNPNEIKRQKRSEMIVNDIFDIYFSRHLKPHTKRPDKMQWHYDFYLKRRIGNKKVSEITRLLVSKIHTDIGTNNGPPTANRVLALIKAMFNKALEWGVLDIPNPAHYVKKYREVPRDRLLTLDELKRLVEAIVAEENSAVRDFFLILILTGVRRGNASSMRWQDLNLDAGLWRIPDTKIGEPLTIPLAPQVVQILNVRRKVSLGVHVFPGTGKSGHFEEPKRAWARILKRAEIENLRVHDLRHAFGSYMAMSGANQFLIRDAMGHKTIQSSSRYVQNSIESIRSAIERSVPEVLIDI